MLLWILIGVALLALEVLSATFFILFFGLAALSIAALLFFASFTMYNQVLGFALLSFLYLVIFRKIFKLGKKKREFRTTDELIGGVAIVHEDIVPHQHGKVLVGDTLWKASSSVMLAKGEKVLITSQNNLTLEVKPL